MKKDKNINSTIILNVISTIITTGISMISAPIISRLLGANNYGVISIYNTWVTIISIVFGLQTVGTYAMARNEYEEDKQYEYQSSCLGLTMVSYTLFSIILAVGYMLFRAKINLSPLMLVFAVIHAFGLQCCTMINTRFVYDFKAINNMIIASITAIFTMLLSIILIISISDTYNYWGRILGYCIFYGIAAIVICIYFFHTGQVFYNRMYWKFCVTLSLPIIAHNLANVILGHFDILMLDKMLNSKVVGIYSFAGTFSGIINIIVRALDKSWIPFYFDYLKKGDSEEIKKHVSNYMILFVVICMGFLLLCKDVFQIYADREFWPGLKLIPIFVIGYFFSFLYRFPTNYEFYCKKTKLVAIGTILAGLINMALNYVFIIYFDEFGAVIATAIANFFLFLFHHIFATRLKSDSEYPLTFFFYVPYILLFGIGVIIVYFISEQRIVSWCLAVMLGIYIIVRTYKNKSIM